MTDFTLGMEKLLVAVTMVSIPSLNRKLAFRNWLVAQTATETVRVPGFSQAAQKAPISKGLVTASTI
jgi:hypothetical protein